MGKKVIFSILGIPIVLISAILIFLIFSVIYDMIVGDISLLRIIIGIFSSIGLILMAIFSLIKKSTLIRILRGQLGT